MQKRIVFFVDGFNLWHSLDENNSLINPISLRKYKWLDLDKLAKCFVSGDDISGIYYFTSLATWHSPEKIERHKNYILALRSVNVKTVFGHFKVRDKRCRKCNQIYQTHEEKQTDVNIATYLFKSAVLDEFDKAVILSGDTDLVPAIEIVKSIYPAKEIGVMLPIGRRADLFKQAADFKMKIKEKHLALSQFQDELKLGDGMVLRCPDSWK